MKTLSIIGPDLEQVAHLDILVDGGDLCVAGVWNWHRDVREHGLYFVYLKKLGLHFGPFYADLLLADKDMKKALKKYPRGFWGQPLEWYQHQKAFQEWVEKNMGKRDDLIGGTWIKDEKKVGKP